MSACARGFGLAAALGLLFGVAVSPAEAQTPNASRWMAFVGCWEPLGTEGETGLLCFDPSGDGVEMSNVFQGEVTAAEFIVADGVPRAVTAEGCAGTESVEFSDDGRRVFTESSFVCEGGEERAGTGVMSFIAPNQWVDVRSLTVEGEPVAWVQRYSAATPESLSDHGVDDPMDVDRSTIRARRIAASREVVIEDVEEALDRIDSEAVKVWLATHEPDLDIDGETLLRLADAGVPDDVIDVMVAVSFPERFALTPEGVPEEVRDRVATSAYRTGRRYYGYRSFLYDPFYAPIGYRYGYAPYGYSRFGYYGYGYGGYYGYVPASIVVIDREPQSSGGRIVRGRGYRPSSRGSASSGSGRSDRGSISRSPSGGRSTSSGSSGSSGGRRAVRR